MLTFLEEQKKVSITIYGGVVVCAFTLRANNDEPDLLWSE
jgi:hypothetical protein